MIYALIQALQETRELAMDHDEDGDWQQVQTHLDALIDQLTLDGDASSRPAGSQRLDRTVSIDEQQAELAAAALAVLHDRPEPEQLELARAALQQLDDAID